MSERRTEAVARKEREERSRTAEKQAAYHFISGYTAKAHRVLPPFSKLRFEWEMFRVSPNQVRNTAVFTCEFCGNTIEVDQKNGRELIEPLLCPRDSGCGGFPLSSERPTRFNLVLPMTSWELLSQTRAMEAGVDIDALRENLRLHLLERAQGEFDNPRPHQYAYSNDLLDELVRIRPRTKNALRSINGMGPWRMESSEEILRIIDEWLMRRCVHSIQSNMELLAVNPEREVSVTPEVLDDISQHFVEWARGRDESPKRISTVEAKQKILELMGGFSDSNGKLRVSELRGGLADRDMVLSPSRLSQIITSMVNDDLIVRKRPVRYEKGVVILEFTEKGLAESLQD